MSMSWYELHLVPGKPLEMQFYGIHDSEFFVFSQHCTRSGEVKPDTF